MIDRMRHVTRLRSSALACGALALFSFSNLASSEPSPPVVRFPIEQPVALSARVALLEQKVHSLELRVKAFERLPPAAATARLPDPCDPPFTVDPRGMRSIKPECSKVDPCDPPYSVDLQGIRIPKKECL